jgi:hypothetical protein
MFERGGLFRITEILVFCVVGARARLEQARADRSNTNDYSVITNVLKCACAKHNTFQNMFETLYYYYSLKIS